MQNFHALSVPNCLKELGSSPKGLSEKEVAERLKKYGLNKLPEKKPKKKIFIFLEQFKSPLIYILMVAGAFSLVLKERVDAGVIFGAVFLNTIIGFFQENKANNALEKLKEIIKHKALVLRNGNEIEIDSSQVVVGDIIIIEAGNRIPADSRIIESGGLKMNESALTGESSPSSKITDKIKKETVLADRENMAYAGTVASSGRGRAVIVAVGLNTEIGKISELVASAQEEKTPLQKRLAHFSGFLGVLFVVVCFLVLLIGVHQGRDFWEMFLVSISLAVASIPEGLLVAVTFILVLGMQRILKEKALTRRLIAAETLGSTTVICSDKTGTLTEGKMSVSSVIIGKEEYEVDALGSRGDSLNSEIVSLVLQICLMCNDAFLDNSNEPLKKQAFIGTPTDVALFSLAIQSGLSKERLLKLEPRIDEIAFSSEAKFMATLHKWRKNHFVLYEKGAPEIILDKSANFYQSGKKIKLSVNHRAKLDVVYENMTKKGLRVIGVAIKEMGDIGWKAGKSDWAEIDNGLTFVGFVALKDPLRPEAKQAIKETIAAGIRPIIITGDHKLTALAIGKEIGLSIKENQIIIGKELDKLNETDLAEKIDKINIYARVSPEHKLRIIKALQKKGEVVAMTGDGINDSPALKAADIGISLGTGTDIAKETSDMVLLDNNFGVIVSAIREGRIIFHNIRKVIVYLVFDSFAEIVLVVGSIFFGLPLAILPAQILWINIVNDGFPHFSLAFERSFSKIMREKPIDRKEPIVNREMATIIFGTGGLTSFIFLALFFWLFKSGMEINYLRTVFFTSLAFRSLISIFSLRSFRRPIWRMNPFGNLYMVSAVAISFSLLLAAVYWPPLSTVMSTVSLDLKSWLYPLAFALLSVFSIEMTKLYFTAKEKNND